MAAVSIEFRVDGGAADPALLLRMQAAADHRGPGHAERTFGPVGMGHRASASSLAEVQPRTDASRGHSIVLAGRLYNLDEVTRSLGAAGAPVGDGSHAAAMLAAYGAWGDACVERFDGDFAFAIHDAPAKAMLCACDPLGVKPLYYAFDGRRFLAATEPKQLLAAGVGATPSEEKIASYLSLAAHLGGGAQTFLRDVRRLRGGHRLRVDGAGARESRYWSIDPAREIPERSGDAMAERVRWLMTDAVARRAPPTGPYGCALSGGFDSSSIAALYRAVLSGRGVGDPLETFSFMLRDDDSDEREIIDAVARQVGANHHHVYVDRSDAFAPMGAMTRALDAPIADMGVMLLWRKKEQAALRGVPTVLSGLGGDELFMGRMLFLADLLRGGRLLALRRELLACRPVDPTTSKPASLGRLVKDCAVLPLVPRRLKRRARSMLLRERPHGGWIRPGLAARTDLTERVLATPPRVFRDAYRQDCWEVFHFSLLGEALPIHEALGGAFAVDTRFPLLDRRLVEYMFAAPREQKVSRGRVRLLQRRAMEGLLPEAVLSDHLKKDFHPVMIRQQRANFERALDALPSRGLLSEPYVDWDHLRARRGEYLGRGSKGWFPLLYALSLEHWLRMIGGGRSGA